MFTCACAPSASGTTGGFFSAESTKRRRSVRPGLGPLQRFNPSMHFTTRWPPRRPNVSSGISAATRKIPYGIQQPAVSGQILQLEKSLGQKLFQRRPFALTPAGRELFAFAQPFFGRIGEVSRRLRSDENARLRLAAPATILRDYLPNLLRDHQRKTRLCPCGCTTRTKPKPSVCCKSTKSIWQ